MSLLSKVLVCYEMDAASGNETDAHGAGPTLTETSGTIPSVAGKCSTARDFEAGDSEWFEDLTLASIFNLTDADWSFSAWVNPESAANTRTVFGKDNTASQRSYRLYTSTSINPTFTVSGNGAGSGATNAIWGSAFSNATWQWVYCFHDSVNNLIGIDVNNSGTPVTASHTTGIFNGTAPFVIGGANGTNNLWDGLIDQVCIFTGLLTSGEQSELYNSGNGLHYSLWGAAAGHPASRRFGAMRRGNPWYGRGRQYAKGLVF